MRKKIYIGLGTGLFFILFFFSIINVKALTTPSPHGDPNRIIPTNLEYEFPNGTYCAFKSTNTLRVNGSSGNGTSIEVHDDITSENTYRMQRIVNTKLSSTTSLMDTKEYKNNTDTPSEILDFSEWDYQSSRNVSINNTFAGLIQGQYYFPNDVFIDDLLINDDSMFLTMLSVLSGGSGLSMISEIYSMLDNLTTGGNITLYRFENSSNTHFENKYDGLYEYRILGDARLNDILDLSNFYLNLSFTFRLNAHMNCYHIMDSSSYGFIIGLKMVNGSNPLQFMNATISMNMGQELYTSTLIPCGWGYEFFGNTQGEFLAQNWLWLLLVFLATAGLATIIAIMLSRKQCEKTINMVRGGTDRPLTTEEFNVLPKECKINKYNPNKIDKSFSSKTNKEIPK